MPSVFLIFLCVKNRNPILRITHYALRIIKTGLEDLSAADKTFIYLASLLVALGAGLVLLRRMRQKSEGRYYRRG